MPTMAMRQLAAKQALALVAAGMDDDFPDGQLADLLDHVDDVALVVGSLVGMVTGVLKSLNDTRPGTSERFLHGMGLSLESMADGDG